MPKIKYNKGAVVKNIMNIWLNINDLNEMKMFTKSEIFISILSCFIGCFMFVLILFSIWYYETMITQILRIFFLKDDIISKFISSMFGIMVFSIFCLPLQIYKWKYTKEEIHLKI